MREQFEALKNGCPWRALTYGLTTDRCFALANSDRIDDRCHYKNCAILYWIRHLKKMENAES